MDRQGVKTLLIDVRNNGGGNSQFCDQLLSWLKSVEETQWMTGLTRISKLWETQYPEKAKMYKEACQQNGIAYPLGELIYSNFSDDEEGEEEEESEMNKILEELFVMNLGHDSLFTGKVIFMQGKDTFSAAGDLITTAVDNGIVIVIGENGT